MRRPRGILESNLELGGANRRLFDDPDELKDPRGDVPIRRLGGSIRDDQGRRRGVEEFLVEPRETDLSQGIRPACSKERSAQLDG